MSKFKRCKDYCGLACVDGTCPMANREEYAERGYDVVHNCNECHYYKGCEDCCFEGNEQYCPKFDMNTESEENNDR